MQALHVYYTVIAVEIAVKYYVPSAAQIVSYVSSGNRADQLCGSSIYTMMSSLLIFLFQEYNVRANASTDKAFSIGRFVTGLPPFSKKKNAENKWSLHKEGLQGRQLTDKMLVCTFGSSFIIIYSTIIPVQ